MNASPRYSHELQPWRAMRRRRPIGFTLIETMAVLAILGVLVALVIGLASRVTTGGKFNATRNAIEALDSMATEYSTLKSGQVPSWVRTKRTQSNTGNPGDANLPDQVDSNAEYIFPIVDGRYEARPTPPSPSGNPGGARFDRELDPAQPTGALFLLAASDAPEVKRAMERLDPKLIRTTDVWAWGWRLDPVTELPTGMPVLRRLRVPVPTDAFGYPMRVVHPAFHGGWGRYFYQDASGAWVQDGADAQHPARNAVQVEPAWEQLPAGPSRPTSAMFTRSYRPFNPTVLMGDYVGDSDEGTCVGSRVYFYSPGADGDAGTRSDNVYTTQPTFPAQTARSN
ncbi:MAG: type II secretion system protein [Phycisphaerales bacterium]